MTIPRLWSHEKIFLGTNKTIQRETYSLQIVKFHSARTQSSGARSMSAVAGLVRASKWMATITQSAIVSTKGSQSSIKISIPRVTAGSIMSWDAISARLAHQKVVEFHHLTPDTI